MTKTKGQINEKSTVQANEKRRGTGQCKKERERQLKNGAGRANKKGARQINEKNSGTSKFVYFFENLRVKSKKQFFLSKICLKGSRKIKEKYC